MANGDKLYTVNDGGTVKVLKDTAGTNALVKAFSITGEDSVAPTGLAILNPKNDKSRITRSELILHCKIITSSIYAWIPLVLYANADSNNNVDALRLGFDGDGAYYWWTYDRVKIRINSVSLDDSGNILISGGKGSSVARYFETSGVQYWVPFLLPSTIKNSRLLTVTENNVEKLTAFNSRLLLQRRGYEQDPGNGVVSEVKYPAWHVPLAIIGDSGSGDIVDYLDWYDYTGTGTHNKLLESSDRLYNFSFVTDSATVDHSVKLSSLLSAWVAPTSYWYDTTSSSTGLNPLLNNVLTKATDAKIIITNDGALSQNITSEYQIPNYRREGYLAVLNAGICSTPDSYSNHVMGYDANMGFFYYRDNSFTIRNNDHMGVQFTSASYPNLRYALTINTNNAPTYYRAHEVLIRNNTSSPLSVQRPDSSTVTVAPGGAAFVSLNSPNTYEYTITDSSYGFSEAVTLNYNSDSGRLIIVSIPSKVVTLGSVTPDNPAESVATGVFTAPPHYSTNPSADTWKACFPNKDGWHVEESDPGVVPATITGTNRDFEVVVTSRASVGWSEVHFKVTRQTSGGKSFDVKYDSAYVMTIVKKWQ